MASVLLQKNAALSGLQLKRQPLAAPKLSPLRAFSGQPRLPGQVFLLPTIGWR
jgi:hypothetical protein